MTLSAVGLKVEVDFIPLARGTLVEDGLAVERYRAIASDLEAMVWLLVFVALKRQCGS